MDLVLPVVIVGLLGLAFGVMLAWLAQKFAVETNPLVQKVEQVLPGANCGACGYPGCSGLAEAIAQGKAEPDSCPVGGPEIWSAIGKLIGKEVNNLEGKKAVLLCQGGEEVAVSQAFYQGVEDCRAASVLNLSFKACRFGCLGLGSCQKVCPFEAITIDPDNRLPIINLAKCTGCGKCVEVCPRGVLALVPNREQVLLACQSLDKAREVRRICQLGCTKCRLCVKVCPEEAISFAEGRIHIDRQKCNLCGKCLEKCPVGCLVKFSPKGGIVTYQREKSKEKAGVTT
ncbi:MAG: H+/Na+-translocating ferredoxin:NAD+ oxidoreductase subunit [Candidatus Atribacteria bacterium]|nr:H+/Na+-translocating ferredoxin:NAD+ oxidoreductase subunit [Candidatus Atribacteria bacterium]